MDLQGLGAGQNELLDLIDKVQFAQIGKAKFPQIAVVGDQSSGKSSVLTSLTGIPFDRNSMACTRYATEIRLRRDSKVSTKVWIIPDKNRTSEEKRRLESFERQLSPDSEQDLETYMKEATSFITPSRGQGGQPHKFAAMDKLIIQKSGPDQPLLTLVDLPGLVKIHNSEQSAEDLKTIEALSDAYMKDPTTIILAVVSGNIDFVQGIILEKAAQFDPQKSRTIGVLTKPDLTEAQGYTNKYIDLVTKQDRNVKYHFKLGWYVLLNPGHNDYPTMDERQSREAEFFQTGPWVVIPPEMRGAEALRAQLSVQLQRSIVRRIKSIQRQIQKAEDECDAELKSLGVGLETPQEMLTEFSRLFGRSDNLMRSAVEGTYRNPLGEVFFTVGSDGKGAPAQNLRARVSVESDNFVARFKELSRKVNFINDNGEVNMQAKKAFAAKTVAQMLRNIRGCELPGDINPRAPYELFREHSTEWPKLAREYQDNITAICHAFLSEILDYVWPTRMQSSLQDNFLMRRMRVILADAREELEKLNADNVVGEIQPFDPDYEEHMNKVNADAHKNGNGLTVAERVVEQMLHYYKLTERVYIRNVIFQVAERHLLAGMLRMFRPDEAHRLEQAAVEAIVADDKPTRDARTNLKLRKERIQEARDICAKIATRRDLQMDDGEKGDDDSDVESPPHSQPAHPTKIDSDAQRSTSGSGVVPNTDESKGPRVNGFQTPKQPSQAMQQELLNQELRRRDLHDLQQQKRRQGELTQEQQRPEEQNLMEERARARSQRARESEEEKQRIWGEWSSQQTNYQTSQGVANPGPPLPPRIHEAPATVPINRLEENGQRLEAPGSRLQDPRDHRRSRSHEATRTNEFVTDASGGLPTQDLTNQQRFREYTTAVPSGMSPYPSPRAGQGWA